MLIILSTSVSAQFIQLADTSRTQAPPEVHFLPGIDARAVQAVGPDWIQNSHVGFV